MIAAILIILAAVFKSVADTCAHHYDTSVFRRYPRKYWDAQVVIKSAPVIFNYPLDAWHISTSCMLLCFMLLAIFNDCSWAWYQQLAAGGGIFIVVFNTFYNKIWRRK